ncbi:hypothetical protein [Curtobacterium sp. MCLR17_039]|uniref:hypothetical protein n=1 Tax=Curtobacterium sp. MCLR17_039 TaxID=2175624 RepID=UPI0015E896C3|nr:hypothetical protein [Curtobacterium sp. MCLR17_039]
MLSINQYSINILNATKNTTISAKYFDTDDTFMYFYDEENVVVYARQKSTVLSVRKA